MSGLTHAEQVAEGLIDAAIDILVERVFVTIATPKNVRRWRESTRMALRASHDERAFGLLAATDVAGVSAKMLADWLDPAVAEVPAARTPRETRGWEPAELYADADRRRRERDVAGWLDAETQARCVVRARAALSEDDEVSP